MRNPTKPVEHCRTCNSVHAIDACWLCLAARLARGLLDNPRCNGRMCSFHNRTTAEAARRESYRPVAPTTIAADTHPRRRLGTFLTRLARRPATI